MPKNNKTGSETAHNFKRGDIVKVIDEEACHRVKALLIHNGDIGIVSDDSRNGNTIIGISNLTWMLPNQALELARKSPPK